MFFFILCGAREGGFGVIAFYCGLVWVENEAVAQGLPQRTEAPGRGCVMVREAGYNPATPGL